MAKEIRFILFDIEEVRAAVTEFLAKRTNVRIGNDVAKVELGQGEEGPFGKVHFLPALRLEARAIRTVDLLEAVLTYCARRRIPLPLRGTKTLEITEDNLVLSIRRF